MFGRKKEHEFTSEEMRKLGRLEAVVESLELKWVIYRDEMKKLVNRLEKRDERLEKRLREAANTDEIVEPAIAADGAIDEVTKRVLGRRNRVHAKLPG